MNSRVDQTEDPNGRRHIADTGPHAHHGTSVVISLQRGALLTLGKNDGRVDNLVELGQVEDPAKVSQTLVPETTDVTGVRLTASQLQRGVGNGPFIGQRAVCGGVTVATGSIDLTERVHDTDEAIGLGPGREGVAEGLQHADKSPGGIDSQEDIVQNDEQLEQARVAKGIGLVAASFIDAIDQNHSERIDGSDGNWDPHIQHLVIEIIGNVEGLFPGPFRDMRRRNGHGELVGRKLEEGGGRKSDADGGRTKLGGHFNVEHGEPKARKGKNRETENRSRV